MPMERMYVRPHATYSPSSEERDQSIRALLIGRCSSEIAFTVTAPRGLQARLLFPME